MKIIINSNIESKEKALNFVSLFLSTFETEDSDECTYRIFSQRKKYVIFAKRNKESMTFKVYEDKEYDKHSNATQA